MSVRIFPEALHVGAQFLPEALHVGVQFRPEALHVSAHFLPEALHIGAQFFPEALDVGTHFLAEARKSARTCAKSARTSVRKVVANFRPQFANFGPHLRETLIGVGPRVAPDGDHEAGQGHAHGQDSDEFRGHGRLPSVGLRRRRPCDLNGSTGRGVEGTAGMSACRWTQLLLS